MLKISQLEPVNHAVVLRLEGRVVGPWVTELQKSCEEVLIVPCTSFPKSLPVG